MNLQKAWIGALFIIVCGVNASGHEGKPHNWHDLSRSWSLEPAVVIGLLLSAALFACGVHYLWREAGTGRGIKKWEALSFALGWLALFVALVSPVHAWGQVVTWLACDTAWMPEPTERRGEILGELFALPGVYANLVPDAHLAALAMEHGLTLCSTDGDFARFPGLSWLNPLAP